MKPFIYILFNILIVKKYYIKNLFLNQLNDLYLLYINNILIIYEVD